MSADLHEKNQIEIFHVENPHKFWFKYVSNAENNELKKHEEKIAKYISDLIEWEEQLPPYRCEDIVAAYHPKWKKWIRGKAGKLIRDKQTLISIWAIDYGFSMQLPLDQVILLQDRLLAYKRPINVYLGGVSGISPAITDYNLETLTSEWIQMDDWTPNATEIFIDSISNRKIITFEVKVEHSIRKFGKLFLHKNDNVTNVRCAAQILCELNVAIANKNFLNDVRPLNRDDFLRLDNVQKIWLQIDDADVNNVDEFEFAERILVEEDPVTLMNLNFESVSQQEILLHHQQASQSSVQGYSGLNSSSLSTMSMTLSVKSLNKLNAIIVTDDEVVPVKEWRDISYFSDRMKQFLMQFYQYGIDLQCAYGWPHIMRTNSLLLIGHTNPNTLLCLPTICTTVWRKIKNWTTSTRIDPVAIIFVANTEDIGQMANNCRQICERSKYDIRVFCLNSSFEAEGLLKNDPIDIKADILVTTVFCYESIINQMSQSFRPHSLQYVWFHQFDVMCHINEMRTMDAVDKLLSQGLDIQIVTTSETYCPKLLDLFHRVKLPMISIGNRTPFEAALFADCQFVVKYMNNESKTRNLIDKLKKNKLAGSIVIVCASKADVKHVSGSLTQANIKCIELDEQYSRNQMKLVNWTNCCVSFEHQQLTPNILVCDDKDLSVLPIRTANHIVHYSLPDKLKIFMQRFITCYGFFDDYLRRELIQNDANLQQSISLVYFDLLLTAELMSIYELLLTRTNCHMPIELEEIVGELKLSIEQNKKKPICPELITRAKDCIMGCPYRHIAIQENETNVPHHGYVNMKLLDVLAPNHFSVQVLGHKRQTEHRSKPIECDWFDKEFTVFETTLRKHYARVERQKHDPIEVGDMCMIFHHNEPKRCRVLSKRKKNVKVYLIDTGRVRQYTVSHLYRLDEEFHDFPSKAIEVFVLGYLPSDCNPVWRSESKQAIENLLNKYYEKRDADNYLQAEVLTAFERTLIVKHLKIMFKGEQHHQSKSIEDYLVKIKVAQKVPIEIHKSIGSTSVESTVVTIIQNQPNEYETEQQNRYEIYESLDWDVSPNYSQASNSPTPSYSINDISMNSIKVPVIKPAQVNEERSHESSYMPQPRRSAVDSIDDYNELYNDRITAPITIENAYFDDSFGSFPENFQLGDSQASTSRTPPDSKPDTSMKNVVEPAVDPVRRSAVDLLIYNTNYADRIPAPITSDNKLDSLPDNVQASDSQDSNHPTPTYSINPSMNSTIDTVLEPVQANESVHDIDGPLQQQQSAADLFYDYSTPYANTITAPTTSEITNLDDIFGSLPENIQAGEVLRPIKSNQVNEIENEKKQKNEHEEWLIDFSL